MTSGGDAMPAVAVVPLERFRAAIGEWGIAKRERERTYLLAHKAWPETTPLGGANADNQARYDGSTAAVNIDARAVLKCAVAWDAVLEAGRGCAFGRL